MVFLDYLFEEVQINLYRNGSTFFLWLLLTAQTSFYLLIYAGNWWVLQLNLKYIVVYITLFYWAFYVSHAILT